VLPTSAGPVLGLAARIFQTGSGGRECGRGAREPRRPTENWPNELIIAAVCDLWAPRAINSIRGWTGFRIKLTCSPLYFA
ncbi:hypothetical protein J6590_018528, partial [Homalodisca vitripennis]